jgi:UDP-galactopyranose mutase
MNTFHAMWGVTTPAEAQAKIDEQRREAGISEPQNLEEQAISLVGRDIYQTLIKGYTEKQWGCDARELPSFIIRRLPVRLTFDNNYFNDRWQGIPIGGYNKIIDALLEGVEVRCNTDFFANREEWLALCDKVIFTGRIDEYYDFRFGALDYRSLRFEHESLPIVNYQGCAVVNYTEREIPYTRIIEHKHFEFGTPPSTIITREYPDEFSEGKEPYYPISDERNNALAEQYRSLATKDEKIIFGGRLGEYRYYDMDKVIESALKLDIR